MLQCLIEFVATLKMTNSIPLQDYVKSKTPGPVRKLPTEGLFKDYLDRKATNVVLK